jgi:glycosyltransferase involved in cell wall biosynthesis
LRDHSVIGYYGSFFDWEGIDGLISALPAILDKDPGVRLLLAGGGRAEGKLRRIVDAKRLSGHVIFAGRVNATEMLAYYGAAKVMVFPRVSNRLTEMVTPLKPLEAMAQNTPVVASDIGGHRELINEGATGFLYPPGDNDALANCLLHVMSGDNTDIVKAARAYVENHRRWSVVAKSYLPIYRRFGVGQE